MTFVPSIQAYLVGGGRTEYTFQCVPNWRTNWVYVASTAVDMHAWMSRFQFVSGIEGDSNDLTAMVAGAQPEPFGVDHGGRVYMSSSGRSNFCSFMQLFPDLTLRAEWGVSDASWNVPLGLPFPTSGWCATQQGNEVLMIGCSSVLTADPDPPHDTGYPVWVSSGAPFGYDAGPYFADQINPYPCPGTGSDVYIITGPDLPGDVPQSIKLWLLANGGVDFSLVGTLSASDIDATWSHILHAGIILDATDGNLIVKVHNGIDVVTNAAYIIKMRAKDGALMWKVAVPNVDASPLQTSWGRIRHGTYCHFSTVGGQMVTTINTADGSFTTFSTGLSGVIGSIQCFDDTTGAIILYCGFSQTTGSPLLLNATPTSFSGWAALYVIEAYSPPPGGRTGYTRIWGNWR